MRTTVNSRFTGFAELGFAEFSRTGLRVKIYP